jgi:hypothetical protein
MDGANENLPPHRPERLNRPRVTIMNPMGMNFMANADPSPYILSAGTSLGLAGSQMTGQPAADLNNPFFQHLYSQRAGDFVCKQFEGLNRFTKSGLSVGEQSAVWLYAKFRKWSRSWFTHFFLFTILLVYTFGGGLLFIALEGKRHLST